MSQTKDYRIRCPKCQHEQTVQLYDSLNVKESPALKEKLLSNQLNLVSCEQCAVTFRVDKPLLYHDPAHHLMIYLIPLTDEVVEEGERQFTDSVRRLNGLLPNDIRAPDVCLVFNRTELVERIFLYDAGLNERIIEYIKHMIYAKNMNKVTPAAKILLFDAQDSTPDELCFVVQDAKTRKLESVLKYDRKTYTALCEMFDRDEQTPTLLEMFPGPYISARAQYLREQKVPAGSARERRPARAPKAGRKPPAPPATS